MSNIESLTPDGSKEDEFSLTMRVRLGLISELWKVCLKGKVFREDWAEE